MSRDAAIAAAEKHFTSGAYKADLARRVAIPTESQNPERAADLKRYLDAEMVPALEQLGFACEVLTQAKARGPFLYGERIEDKSLPTVLGYGHGDVIRGLDAGWRDGLSPWTLVERDGRYYGRGVVDNKGQHTINLAALGAVLATRGKLGFNVEVADRDRRRDGIAGPARDLCRQSRALQGRRTDRLRRSATVGDTADDVSRLPRRIPDRLLDRRPRRRPSLRQLGRPVVQPGDPAVPRACQRGRSDRADQHQAVEARAHQQFRAQCARRLRGHRWSGRAGDRSELGRAGADAGREGVCAGARSRYSR